MRSAAIALFAAAVFSTPVRGNQLGEFQIGVVAGYSASEPYRAGAGAVAGVAAGRLAYVGLRWLYQFGQTSTVTDGAITSEVRNRAQFFTTDLALQIPVGAVEILPSVSLGLVRFAQRTRSGSSETFDNSKEFVAAPALAVQFSASRIALIPAVQYYFTGRPELPMPVRTRGLVASVRLVFLSEIRRIRR